MLDDSDPGFLLSPRILLYIKAIQLFLTTHFLLKGAQVWDFDLLDFNDFFYHEVYIGRGLMGWNKKLIFCTDGLDMGLFIFVTACAVYANNL